MIEQIFVWTCDTVGCGQRQEARVWHSGQGRPVGLTPLEGWATIEVNDEARNYCRECANKLREE